MGGTRPPPASQGNSCVPVGFVNGRTESSLFNVTVTCALVFVTRNRSRWEREAVKFAPEEPGGSPRAWAVLWPSEWLGVGTGALWGALAWGTGPEVISVPVMML